MPPQGLTPKVQKLRQRSPICSLCHAPLLVTHEEVGQVVATNRTAIGEIRVEDKRVGHPQLLAKTRQGHQRTDKEHAHLQGLPQKRWVG
jgi:hypothetical protein